MIPEPNDRSRGGGSTNNRIRRKPGCGQLPSEILEVKFLPVAGGEGAVAETLGGISVRHQAWPTRLARKRVHQNVIGGTTLAALHTRVVADGYILTSIAAVTPREDSIM